jgi:hypothetical protein
MQSQNCSTERQESRILLFYKVTAVHTLLHRQEFWKTRKNLKHRYEVSNCCRGVQNNRQYCKPFRKVLSKLVSDILNKAVTTIAASFIQSFEPFEVKIRFREQLQVPSVFTSLKDVKVSATDSNHFKPFRNRDKSCKKCKIM